MLARDEEKLSVLEKRQAHLITENEEMRNLIHETVQQNNHMIHTMDMILNSAMCNVDLAEKGLPLNVPELTVRQLAAEEVGEPVICCNILLYMPHIFAA